ncbi:MAG: hypothetical protein CMJ18_21685 [Phycisphaeraceae bacterium]|nr:hypothetical protein [Phycisphaeraceae bacterium]
MLRRLTLLIAFVAALASVTPGAASVWGPKISPDPWCRAARMTVVEGRHPLTDPSVARAADGRIVMLFTEAAAESDKGGALRVTQSADGGMTWSAPSDVRRHAKGEAPSAMGTLTSRSDGELVAVVRRGEELYSVRSHDGREWLIGKALTVPGLAWAVPHGRIIEHPGNTLVLGVWGPKTKEDVRYVSGLVRSSDGLAWNDFSEIAADCRRPAIAAGREGGLIALVESGAGISICRSGEDGRSWSAPEPALAGTHPHAAKGPDGTFVCVARREQPRPFTFAAFSYDEGRSWRCERIVIERETVSSAPFGPPAALALDDKKILAFYGYGVADSEKPSLGRFALPARHVGAVLLRRNRARKVIGHGIWPTPVSRRHRWRRAGDPVERAFPDAHVRLEPGAFAGLRGAQASKIVSNPPRTVQTAGEGSIRTMARTVDGGVTWQDRPVRLPDRFAGTPHAMMRLSTGRWLCAVVEWLERRNNDESFRIVERRDGLAVWDPNRQAARRSRLFVLRSDDDGRTWSGTDRPLEVTPFEWVMVNHRFVQRTDGSIALSVYGNLNRMQTARRLDSLGLFRSRDDGETWGDFSMIARSDLRALTAYNEADLVALSSDVWVAFISTESRGAGAALPFISRAITTDGGYTWSRPERCVAGGAPRVALLPDRGLVMGHQGAVRITYDVGRTWTITLSAPGRAIPVVVDDRHLLIGDRDRPGHFEAWRREDGAKP